MNKAITTTFFVFAAFIGALYLFSPVLTPFIAALIIAYILYPMHEKTIRYMGNSGSSLFWVFISICVFMCIPLFFLPVLGGLITDLSADNAFNLTSIELYIWEIADRLNLSLERASLMAMLENYTSFIVSFFTTVAKNIFLSLNSVVGFAMMFILTPFVLYFTLKDWPGILENAENKLPKDWRKTVRNLAGKIDYKLAGFLRGQMIVCSLLGIFYAIGLIMVGLNNGFMLGLLTGFLSFIPFVGMLLGCVTSFLVAFAQFGIESWVPYIGLAVVFSLGQILEGYVVTPKIIGDRTGLGPVAIVFALMAGGHQFGLLGMMLAVPFAIFASVLIPFVIEKWHESQ
ncbi:MAG: AI-2E family transporter [Pseudomonadota bacterium]|nr:AI-2E family transporter [Pseudomonadota bacterium]